jgi:hypothetical protein
VLGTLLSFLATLWNCHPSLQSRDRSRAGDHCLSPRATRLVVGGSGQGSNPGSDLEPYVLLAVPLQDSGGAEYPHPGVLLGDRVPEKSSTPAVNPEPRGRRPLLLGLGALSVHPPVLTHLCLAGSSPASSLTVLPAPMARQHSQLPSPNSLSGVWHLWPPEEGRFTLVAG